MLSIESSSAKRPYLLAMLAYSIIASISSWKLYGLYFTVAHIAMIRLFILLNGYDAQTAKITPPTTMNIDAGS